MMLPTTRPREASSTMPAASGTIIWHPLPVRPRISAAARKTAGFVTTMARPSARVLAMTAVRISRRFGMMSPSGTRNSSPSA
jgi:hypothetical protein